MLLAKARLKHLHTDNKKRYIDNYHKRYTKYIHPTVIYRYAAAEYTHCAATYIHYAATYIHIAAHRHNYIQGCFNLQWRATSDTQVYLLVQ